MGKSKDEKKNLEMKSGNDDKSESPALTSTVHTVHDENEYEDPDIDMDLTIADINRAFVS